MIFDVAIIGAGVVGSAIARELAGTSLNAALVEAKNDVCDVTSKANTGLLCTGFDATPGSLEGILVRRGHALMLDYAARTGIAVEHTGAILVAWTQEELDALPGMKATAVENGYDGCEILDSAEVYRRVPALGKGVLGGLSVPDESVICPWSVTVACATDAVQRGATLLLNHRVTAIRRDQSSSVTVLETTGGEVRARWVINAAGLGSARVDRLFGHERFTVTPRRGELFVFDKLSRPLVPHILLAVPTAKGKGVLISPSVYGNVLLGPTSEDMPVGATTATSEKGLTYLWEQGERMMPILLKEEVTATYAGLRAAIDASDYLIELEPAQGYLLVAGIRSTGVSACLAIAEHVADLLGTTGLDLTRREQLPPPPRLHPLGEADRRPYQDDDLIARDPEYGRVVCFCERVTAGELRDAVNSPIPPTDVGGMRRRTRAMNGRCQGFFCGGAVRTILSQATSEGAE
jgi:glycerol-3-phosphate dehydrogenase